VIQGGDALIAFLPTIGWSLFWVLLKLVIFLTGCYLFAHYVEPDFTRFNRRWDTQTGLAISLLGSALVISAIAGYLGFSLAIGALFAGLAFSRDPQAVHVEGRFSYFYELFTPFFFIQIGLQVDPGAVLSSLSTGIVLLVPAVLGKFLGVFLPALRTVNRMDAVRLGISMVPRAEIALVIVYQCQQLGKEVVDDSVFGALVFISIATSIFSPIVLRFLWPSDQED
jgi:Kef-type K+ transport system membrane component KefB